MEVSHNRYIPLEKYRSQLVTLVGRVFNTLSMKKIIILHKFTHIPCVRQKIIVSTSKDPYITYGDTEFEILGFYLTPHFLDAKYYSQNHSDTHLSLI